MKPYYEHAGITIYHGDCREVLPLVVADCFVSDPPYGVSGSVGGNARDRNKADYDFAADWRDDEENIRSVAAPVFRELISRGMRGAITPGTRCMWLYERPRDIGCFWSPADTGFGPWGMICFHAILYYGSDPRGGIGQSPSSRCIQGNAPKNGHPCPKPTKEWTWLVNKVSMLGETILDPFMGSGTTLVAAKQLGRRAIGIEIEERYCEIAVKRLAQEMLPLEPPEPVQLTMKPLDP